LQDHHSPGAAHRATRLKLFEPVLLRVQGLPVRAHLLDLSMTGALAHSDNPPQVGDHVVIEASALSVAGRVMWVRAKRFGIHFDFPLPQPTIDRVVRGD
tara:strand:- start:144 stop:440 length:297 start_codon:yes stop_codon:yes gene_type:complete